MVSKVLKIKFLLKLALVFFLIVLIVFGILFYRYYNKPSVKFILSQAGIINLNNYMKKNEVIKLNGINNPVVHYSSTANKSKKYFVLIHGFAPTGEKHKNIDLLARSITSSTGMDVLVPRIEKFLDRQAKLPEAVDNIREIYLKLNEKYPGKYRAFGSCLAGTALLSALKKVPEEIYPQKIFLYGSFNIGDSLVDLVNNKLKDKNGKQAIRPDFLLKLALTSNMKNFSLEEQDFIHNAMMKVEPGITDEKRMQKILGKSLFNDISIINIDKKFLKKSGASNLLNGYKVFPNCKYFIVHSKHDNIIPYEEGQSLSKFLKKQGGKVDFFGTELFSHTENNISATGLYHELKYMVHFFDKLFKNDIEN